MIETTWISESSFLLLLETKFLTSKSCNTLWKKSMHEHMWLIFVVFICNYLFWFFLDILTLKTFNLHADHEGFRLPGTIKLLNYVLLLSGIPSGIYIYVYFQVLRFLYKPSFTRRDESLVWRNFFPKNATKKAFHGGDFWRKFMGRGTRRNSWSDRIKEGGGGMHFTIICKTHKNYGRIYPWINS